MALDKYDLLIVGISYPTSPQQYNTPFSYFERYLMLLATLRDIGAPLDRVVVLPHEYPLIIPLSTGLPENPLLPPDAVQVFYVTSRRDMNICYWVGQSQRRTDILGVSYFGDGYGSNITGNGIRSMIVTGCDGWKELVPASVSKFILDIGGTDRIRELRKQPAIQTVAT